MTCLLGFNTVIKQPSCYQQKEMDSRLRWETQKIHSQQYLEVLKYSLCDFSLSTLANRPGFSMYYTSLFATLLLPLVWFGKKGVISISQVDCQCLNVIIVNQHSDLFFPCNRPLLLKYSYIFGLTVSKVLYEVTYHNSTRIVTNKGPWTPSSCFLQLAMADLGGLLVEDLPNLKAALYYQVPWAPLSGIQSL